MADTMKFVLELQDKVSGPAKNADGAMKNLDKSLNKTGSSGQDAGDAMGGAAVEFNAIAEIGAKVADVLKEVVSTALEIGKFGVQAKEFKEETMAALNALEGSSAAADAAYANVQKVANAAGVPTEKIAKQYEKLREMGVDSKTAFDVIAGGLDVSKIGASSDGYIEAIAKIKSEGKISPKELNQLGIPVEDLEKNIAKAHGIVIDEGGNWRKAVQQMMESGKLPADEAINDILAATSKLGGSAGLGGLSKGLADSSVTSQLQVLQNMLQDLFASIDIGPLVGALKSLSGLFDQNTESGKEIRAILSEAFSAIGDIVSKVFTKGNIEGFLGAVIDLAHAFGKVWNFVEPLIEAFVGGAWQGIKAAVEPLIAIVGKLFGGAGSGPNSKLIGAFKLLGDAVGFAVGVTVDVLAGMLAVFTAVNAAGLVCEVGIAAAVDWIIQSFQGWMDAGNELIANVENWFTSIPDKIAGFVQSAVDAGSNFIDGLVQGIEDNIGKVIAAVAGVGDSVINTVKDKLGISSPSKVMMEMGMHTADGFTSGVNDNAAGVGDAMSAMTSPPPTTSGPSGGSSKSSSYAPVINITVNGGSSTPDLERAIRNGVLDALEVAGSQMGTALAS